MFAPLRRIAALFALALALPACADTAPASAPPPAEAPKPVATPAAAPPARSGPALWKVADADTTIYLFGTIHALPQGIDWFEGPVADAFAASDELVTEIDTGEAAEAQADILALATLPAGESLRDLMAPDDRVQYEAAMAGLGLPVDALDRFEPWYATINLSMLPLIAEGYDPESGVETALAARAADKRREGLETVSFQIGLFDTMPLDKQLVYLDETVEGIPELSAMIREMVDDWLAGDADALAALMNEEMSDAEIYDRLLIARNARWAEWIARRMDQPGSVFVAVGAGHLAGRGSVQDQLEALGLAVSRVE